MFQPKCLSVISTAVAVLFLFCSGLAAAPGETYLHFNGTGGIIANSGANPNLTGPYTIEAWVLLEPETAIGSTLVLNWGQGSLTGPARSFYLGTHYDQPNATQQGQFEIGQTADGTNNTRLDVLSPSLAPLNQWVHVAGVHTGTELAVYVNGVKQASAPTTSFPFPPAPGSLTTIGGYYQQPTSYPLRAGMDELRISSVARYTSDFAPPTQDFAYDADTLMLYHFNEGTGLSTANAGSLGGMASWTTQATWASGPAVPEPAAILTIAVAALGLLMRRWQLVRR